VPTIQRFPPNVSVDEVVGALRADGGVIVERLFPESVVAAINHEVDSRVATANPGLRHLNPAIQVFFGDRTKHVSGLAAVSRTFATEVMIHPLYLGVCDAILRPSCARYQLNLGHLLARGPGAEAQYLHRDEDVWNVVPRPHPELQLASLVAAPVNGGAQVDHDRAGRHHRMGDVALGGKPLAVPEMASRRDPCRPVLDREIDERDVAGGYLGALNLRDPVELLASGELGGDR
jgi:hypothetical protein